jgi:hypothetical protein
LCKYFGGSIGCVAIAPSDNTILYVGEGENTLRGNVSEGFGIWRTDDVGKSWKNLGLKNTRHIIRIVIHPKNPDVVWVAAIGHLFACLFICVCHTLTLSIEILPFLFRFFYFFKKYSFFKLLFEYSSKIRNI